jgi:hypothetical protein
MSEPEPIPAPPRPGTRELSEDDKWVNSWKEEYGRYVLERPPLKEKELADERNFDNLIVTLATAALGGSIVVAKDLFSSSAGIWFAILSWLLCGGSLTIALLDRHWTYQAHKKWRDMMDEEMSHKKWQPGAWDRLDKEYDNIPHVKLLPKMKEYALWALGGGIVLLLIFIAVEALNRQAASKDEKVIVNVYTTTQPTITRP